MTDDTSTRPSLPRLIGERPLWALLAVVILFFAAPLFFGETFFFRDLSLFFLPQRMRLVELVRTSGIPLWDPYLHGGQPFLANPSNTALYPTALLYFILPAVTALNWEIALHFLLCAFAAYWLSRTLGLAPLSSLIVGVAFTLCGFNLSNANQLNQLLATPHTVFLLLFFHLFLLERKTRWFLGAIASGALAILAGSVEFLLLAMALAFGWALAYQYPSGTLPPRGRAVAWLVLGLSILGVAAIQILPGLEVVGQSRRGSGLEFARVTKWSLDPRRLPELLVPRFLGPTNTLAETDYWGARLEEGYPFVLSIFFGLPVLVLALIEGTARAEDLLPRRFRRFLVASAGAATLLALGRFALLTPTLYRAVPFASVFRYPIKALAAAVLPIALLAGGGAERVLHGGFSRLTDAIKGMLSRGFDPRRHVVLEGRAGAVDAGSCTGASIVEIEHRPASWKGRITAACNGYLVFSEPYYPSWVMSVDGLPKPAIRANVAFSAVAVPAGTHSVSRVYRPASVAAGAALSTASAAVLLILAHAFRQRTGVQEGTTPVTRSH